MILIRGGHDRGHVLLDTNCSVDRDVELPFLNPCLRSTEAVAITLWPPCSLGWQGWQNSGNRQTDRHTQTK